MVKWVNGIGKRGGVYWIRYPNGQGGRIEESAKTANKETAKDLRASRLTAIREGALFPGKRLKPKQKTVQELYDLWIAEKRKKRSIDADKLRLGAAVEFFGGTRLLSTIEDTDVLKWKAHLEQTKTRVGTVMKTASVNRHLAVLRSALNLATKRHWSHQDPMAGIELDKENNERNRICTQEEYAALMEAAVGDLRQLICMGYWLGWREGELAKLRRSQIREGTLWLTSANTKEGAAKSIPLPPDVISCLEELPERDDGKVFSRHRATYSQQFGALCKKLGIEDLHFHDLRHTAVTNLIEAGVDLMTIQSITGHKTLHMLKRYSHISNRARASALDKMRAHLATQGKDASKR